ncbi:MAG: hypothetical protein AAF656_08865 [Planctomycetota bacterium]
MQDPTNGRHDDFDEDPTHPTDAAALRLEAEQQLHEAAEHAKAAAEQARQQLAEWQEGVESFVRERPVQSLLVAAGVGLVLGSLLKR